MKKCWTELLESGPAIEEDIPWPFRRPQLCTSAWVHAHPTRTETRHFVSERDRSTNVRNRPDITGSRRRPSEPPLASPRWREENKTEQTGDDRWRNYRIPFVIHPFFIFVLWNLIWPQKANFWVKLAVRGNDKSQGGSGERSGLHNVWARTQMSARSPRRPWREPATLFTISFYNTSALSLKSWYPWKSHTHTYTRS